MRKMTNSIKVVQLTKHYGDFEVVKGISFQVEKGELFAFLGTNGAGKSTTINMIATLVEKTTGEIWVNGFNTDTEPAKIRQGFGIVFQDNVLDDLLTVAENLRIRGQLLGLTGKMLQKRLAEIKEEFDLVEIWPRPFGKLSGGQKRRCEIARSVIGNPELLILDEPTTGLDPQTRKAIWQLIRQMQVRNQMTVFLTTHYMEEAGNADHVVILESGQIKAEGTPSELKSLYGKDRLRLRFADMEAGKQVLLQLGYQPLREVDNWVVFVEDSPEALTVLNALETLQDFEFIKGSLDEVFLAVTSHKEVPHE